MQQETERRGRVRLPSATPAKVRLTAGPWQSILIEDISATGFSARLPFPVRQGKMVRVFLPTGEKQHARVMWSDPERSGCKFLAPGGPVSLQALGMIWEGAKQPVPLSGPLPTDSGDPQVP